MLRVEQFLLRIALFVFASIVFLSYIHEGSARRTSSFIRSEWPATDIALDDEAFSVPNGQNAPQQVSTLLSPIKIETHIEVLHLNT